MERIQFNAVVDQDQVIRPPKGIVLPQGEIEVEVRPRSSTPPLVPEDVLAATRGWLLTFAADAEKANPSLPSDLAENHDHYAHGKPRP